MSFLIFIDKVDCINNDVYNNEIYDIYRITYNMKMYLISVNDYSVYNHFSNTFYARKDMKVELGFGKFYYAKDPYNFKDRLYYLKPV